MSFFPPPAKPLPPGFPLPAIDQAGNPVHAGQWVRIPVIPEWLTHDLPVEEVSRLKAVEGKAMRILELDAYGYAWFSENGPLFSVRPDDVVGTDADQQ